MATTEHSLIYRAIVDQASVRDAVASHQQIGQASVEAQAVIDTASKEAARQQSLAAKQREAKEKEAVANIAKAQLAAAEEAVRVAKETAAAASAEAKKAAQEQAAVARKALEEAKVNARESGRASVAAAKAAALEEARIVAETAREKAEADAREDQARRQREMGVQRVAVANRELIDIARRARAELEKDLVAERAGAEASRARAEAKAFENRMIAGSIDPQSRIAAMIRQETQELDRLEAEIRSVAAARRQAQSVADAIAKDREETASIERKVAARRISIEALRAEEAAQESNDAAQRLGIALDSAEARELANNAARRRAANAELAGFNATGKQSNSIADAAIGSLKGWALGFVSIGAAAGLARAAITGTIEASAEFGRTETQLVGVAKTTGMAKAEVEDLYDEIVKLSTTDALPIATKELLDYAETAGQLGVSGKAGLLAYVDTLGKLSRTSDIAGQEGAESLAQFINVTGELHSEAGRVGSALTALGNDSSATEKKILSMAQEVAASITEFKEAPAAILGYSTRLVELGRAPEAAATSTATAVRAIQKAVLEGGASLEAFADVAGVSAADFKAAWERGPLEALAVLLAGVEKFGDQGSLALDKLGLSSDRLDKTLPTLATSVGMLTKRVEQGTVAYRENIALANEATTAFDTQESRLQALDNTVNVLRKSFGEGLAVGIERVTGALTDLGRQDEASDFLFDLGTIIGLASERVAKLVGDAADLLRILDAIGGTSEAGRTMRTLGLDAPIDDYRKLLEDIEARRKALEASVAAQPKTPGQRLLDPIGAHAGAADQAALNRLLKEEEGLRAFIAALEEKQGREAKKRLDESIAAGELEGDIAVARITAEKEAEEAAKKRNAAEIRAIKEAEAESKRLESSLQRLAEIEIRVRDTVAETAMLRREAAGFKLPIEEQVELNRQLAIERKILEDSKVLRAILADPKAPKAARDEAAKRLEELKDAARDLVLAEEGLSTASTVKDLSRREEVAKRMAIAYRQGEDAIRRATLQIEKEDAANEVAIATGNDKAAMLQLVATREAEAAAKANERLGVLDRLTDTTLRYNATIGSGADAVIEANRQEEFRARVLREMEGLEEEYREAIEARVRALMAAERAGTSTDLAAQYREAIDAEAELARLDVADPTSARIRRAELEAANELRRAGIALTDAEAAELIRLKVLHSEIGTAAQRANELRQKGLITQKQLGELMKLPTEEMLRQLELLERMGFLLEKSATEAARFADNLSAAGSLISGIGQALGNSNLQQLGSLAGSAGSAVNASANYQSAGSFSSFLGAVGSWIQLFVGIADFMTHKGGTLYLAVNDLATMASADVLGSIDPTAFQAAGALLDVAQQAIAGLGGFLVDLGNVNVRLTSSGEALAEDIHGSVRSFGKDVAAAMEFAVITGIKTGDFIGLSPEVAQAIRNSTAESLDRFMADVQTAQHISDLRTGSVELGREIRQLVTLFDEQTRAAERLGLSTRELIGEFSSNWQSIRDRLTGVTRSPLEQAQRDAEAFNAARDAFLSVQNSLLVIQEEKLRQQAAFLLAEYNLTLEQVRAGEFSLQMVLRLGQEFQDAVGLVAVIDAEIARIRNTMAGVPGGIDPGEVRVPGGSGGGRRQERASLNDRLRDIVLSGESELTQDLARRREEITKLQEEIARLGPDSALAAAALAVLRGQLGQGIRDEVAAANAGRPSRSGLAEGRQGILDHWQEIEDAVREHLQETGERIVTFWEIRMAEAAALRAWTEQQIEGFGLPIEDTRAAIDLFHERMAFLEAALKDGSISAERYADVTKQLSDQLKSEALGLAASLLETVGATDEAAAARKAIAVLQFEIDKRRLNMLYAELEATGQLSDAERQRWKDMLALIDRFDPSTIGSGPPPPVGGGGSISGGREEDPLEEARRFLERLRDMDREDRSGLNAERERARETFLEMTEDARRMAWQFRQMGIDVGDVLKDIARVFERTMKELEDQANESLRDAVHGILFGPESPIPIGDQIAAARAEYERLRIAALGGDLDARAQLGGAFAELYNLLSNTYGGSHGEATQITQQFLAMMRGFGINLNGLDASFNAPRPGQSPTFGFPANDSLRQESRSITVREDMMAANRGTETRLDQVVAEIRRLNDRMSAQEGLQRDHHRTFEDIARRLSRSAA